MSKNKKTKTNNRIEIQNIPKLVSWPSRVPYYVNSESYRLFSLPRKTCMIYSWALSGGWGSGFYFAFVYLLK